MPIAMGDQFKGLPMGDLIGGPLMASCDAQLKLAAATADFIKVVGFEPPDKNGAANVRQVTFAYDRPAQVPAAGQPASVERVQLQVPLLAVVRVPSLFINSVDVVFDMEVRNSETQKESFDATAKMEAQAQVGWGPFSLKVNISGSVSSHKENTRQTDQSAKYHVEVHAQDNGMPEGLARVLDLINSSVAPRTIAAASATPAPVPLIEAQPAK